MQTRTSSNGTGTIQPTTEFLLTSLINSANHLVWCTSLDGTQLLYANPVAAKIYGRPMEELVARQDYWLQAIHPDDRATVLRNLSELPEKAEIEQEYRIVRPDGSVVWLHDRISVVHDASGRPIYVGGIGTDITAIRESEARYSSLVESLPLHVIRKDVHGKVVFGNQRYCESVGRPLEDLIGKTDFDLFPADLAAKYVEDDKRVLQSGEVFNDIEEHQTSDGQRVYVEIFKGPVRDSLGKISGIQVMYWDVTERKQAEEEVRIAKEWAEAASRAKSEFLANMSHEIRTPMNGILGMIDLLLSTTPTDEQREYLRMAKQSADSLLRLLNDILDFSKIEAGKLDLEQSNFSLRDCVEQTAQSLGARAGEKELEFLCRVAPDVPDMLVGDAGRLGQILVNLLGNSIKFTEQGEVEIDVSRESNTDDQIELHFSVRDTGIGIPPEQQQRIFESFSQVDASTTRRFGGTGLGLAISLQLVEMMNGRIWVESEVDKGTTFHFTATFDVHDQQPGPPAGLERLRGMKVLVVDDNKTSRKIIKEVIRGWGLVPTVVESGLVAIEKMKRALARKQPYTVVILDSLMMGMDGFNVAACIHEDDQLHGSHVIMLSSAAKAGHIERCRRLGVQRYMQKPVVRSELLDTILRLAGVGVGEQTAVIELADHQASDRPKLRILLAEDGVVNQQVAIGLLTQLGHEVVVANDGREALAAMDEQPFDLVLMDVQMPNMDGHEATRLIRKREQGSGRHIPIIAMTAGAMKGDQERCIESGMDGYISKPVDRQRLYDAVDEFTVPLNEPREEAIPPEFSNSQGSAKTMTTPDPEVIDFEAARELCCGDDERIAVLAQTLLEESASLMTKIRSAIESGDPVSVRRYAHTLKGSAAVFGAAKVIESSLRLELIGKEGSLDGIEGPLADLERDFAQLTAVLQQLVHPT